MKALATALPERLLCLGVGGSGVSALATLLARAGHRVRGVDADPTLDLEPLARAGVDLGGDEPLADVQLVVRSAAVPDDDPLVVEATRRGVPVVKYAEAVGRLMRGRAGIAVAGAHGKTTVTALVAHLLAEAGHEPGWIVGGRPLGRAPSTLGTGAPLVVEACEYDRSFLALRYDVAVVIDDAPDHLDCFGSPDAVLDAYRAFVGAVAPGGTVVLGARVREAVAEAAGADVTVRRADEVTITASVGTDGVRRGELDTARGGRGRFTLRQLGDHSLQNMVVAVLAVEAAGLAVSEALAHVETFGGVSRRLEDLGEHGGVRWIDDFAHHPDELDAVAASLRERFGGRRLVAVFQPHQVSRTETFLAGLAEALRRFDLVLLCDIFVARDARPERAERAVEALAAALGDRARRVGPARGALPRVSAAVADGDVCAIIGAGDIDGLARRAARAAARP